MTNPATEVPAAHPRPDGSRPPAYGLAPMLLSCLTIVVILLILTFGVPRFAAFYEDMGAALPLVTRLVLAASGLVRSLGLAVVPAGAARLGGLIARPLLVRHRARRVIAVLVLLAHLASAALILAGLILPLRALATVIN